MQIPLELKTLIETGPAAHLVTLNRDGSPHVTVIWIGLDGDDGSSRLELTGLP